MPSYENLYFHLRLDFPDEWKVTSWKHCRIKRNWRSLYQNADDDLPTKADRPKALLNAYLHPPQSELVVRAEIELSIHRLGEDEDMGPSLRENLEKVRGYHESFGTTNSIVGEGRWSLAGMDFSYVDEESRDSSGYLSRYRFFFRRFRQSLWLYGRIAAHDGQLFHEVLRLVEGMRATATTPS